MAPVNTGLVRTPSDLGYAAAPLQASGFSSIKWVHWTMIFFFFAQVLSSCV